MEIDAHNLPEEAGLLRQIVLQLLGVVEEKDRLLERVQHQLQQLLQQRYGPKRERIDENQPFLFAAQIIAARQAKAAEPGVGSGASGTTRRAHVKGHGRKPLPASLEGRRVVFDLEEAQRQCRDCQKPYLRSSLRKPKISCETRTVRIARLLSVEAVRLQGTPATDRRGYHRRRRHLRWHSRRHR